MPDRDPGSPDTVVRRHHPIAITGMHRSGTSMITRGLHDSGLALLGGEDDRLIEAADDNPEGFWENKAIVACNDDLLELTGGAWDRPPEILPTGVDDPRVAHLVDAATLALDGLRVHDHWGFKDPRVCLTARYWLDLEPDLRFVLCVRNPLEVALSLKRRNQNSYALGLALWERYYRNVLETVPEDRLIVTHYDSYFVDAAAELRRLCEFAGLEAAEPRVRSDLRHHDVGVSLEQAAVSDSLQALYGQLCDAAGVQAPEPSGTTAGQVNRLVLDGAVAQRHADQRQEAIARLEERLAESRANEAEAKRAEAQARRESADLDAKRQARIREVEAQFAAAQGEIGRITAANRDLTAANRILGERIQSLVDATRSLGDAVTRTENRVGVIDQRTKDASSRLDETLELVRGGRLRRAGRRIGGRVSERARTRVVQPGRRVMGRTRRAAVPVTKRTAKATARRLPVRVQNVLKRGRRVVRDKGVVAGTRSAVRVANRRMPAPAQRVAHRGRQTLTKSARAAAPRVERIAHRLPGPGGDIVGRGRRLVTNRGVVGAAEVASKKVARRLPEPARKILRRGRAAMGATRPSAPSPSAPTGRAPETPARPVPKGPPFAVWSRGYERLVGSEVGEGQPWLVATPGSPDRVRSVGDEVATAFAGVDGADAELSLIARLEALRVAGHERLVVPEGSRPWFRQQPELRDHVTSTYRLVADRELAGLVFDLTAGPDDQRRSLLAEISALAVGLEGTPAVLDWTSADIGTELPGFTIFGPPAGAVLPYLDASVEIVVVDRTRDLTEATRVASVGVVVVEEDAMGGLHVASVEPMAATGAESTTPTIVHAPAGTKAWETALARRVVASGAELRLSSEGSVGSVDDLDESTVVIVLESDVLPLPGAIEAAAAAAAAGAIVTGKVLRADGRLDAVGGTVFSDGSSGLIGAGSTDVNGPWHEFRRPVCAASGIVAATAGVWSAVGPLAEPRDGAAVREWCGTAWTGGRAVTYEPTVRVVRLADADPLDAEVGASSPWARLSALRPARPPELSDGAWRYVMAHDDVEACRG